MSSEELCEGLVATCYDGNHWRCDSEVLKLCQLSIDRVEQHVKKWWGNKELWLDMIITELVRALGKRIDLSKHLGSGWQQAVDAWIDATYSSVTSHMNCPPPKPIISTKAAILVADVMKSFVTVSATPAQRRICSQTSVQRTVCNQCGKSYSQRLGRCPICFPSSAHQDVIEVKARAEKKRASWRNLLSMTIHADIIWSEASEMMFCHGGSGGVFLLKFAAGALCVKVEACKPEALFAQRLANALNIRTPWMRAVLPASSEHAAITSALYNTVPTFEDDRLQLSRSKRCQGYTVMEYVDGCSMMGMPAHEYLKQEMHNAELWHGLGKLLGLDLLINNFDRMPLAWSNDGNLANIMLGSRMSMAVGIDQSVQPITHPSGLQDYLSRVSAACLEARDGYGKSFERVKQSVYNNTLIEMSATEVSSLRQGCLDLVTEVVRLASSGEIESILEDISKDVSSELGSSSEIVHSCCAFAQEVIHTLHDTLKVE